MNSRRILRQVSLYAVLLIRILGGWKPVVAGQILRKEIFCRGSTIEPQNPNGWTLPTSEFRQVAQPYCRVVDNTWLT